MYIMNVFLCPSLLSRVKTALADSAGWSLSLLCLELLFELGKLSHGNLLFLIQDLLNALDLLDVVHKHTLRSRQYL